MHSLITSYEKKFNDCIRLCSPVASIRSEDVKCIIELEDGTQLKCRTVICAIPPHLRKTISISPPLPTYHAGFIDQLRVGHLSKFIASYQTRFWVEKGLSGFVCHWPHYDGSENLPVHMTFEVVLPSGTPGIVGFIATSKCTENENETKKQIVNSLVKYFGIEASHPIDIVLQNWSTVAYNGGCPTTFSNPGLFGLEPKLPF